MYKDNYNSWIASENISNDIKNELLSLDEKEIKDRFYKNLEFGTGGLRGVMEYGTNRMNKFTVRRATQGIAEELLACAGRNEKSVVIAHDSRNNSREFAKEAANVFCANGIKTFLFDSLRPTPELSFAVRHLGCERGVVITASHNPKEYNGYKVYGEDGGQIPPETADKITEYINKVDVINGAKTCDNPDIKIIGKEIDDAYLKAVKEQSFDIEIPDDFKVIYTPIHGSGNLLVQAILKKIGVKNLFVVPEQEKPDGNFPTVISPNPENKEAFTIAIEYAKKQNADLIFGTDPDSDRIGVVVRNKDGNYEVLSGNQTGTLLCEYILRKSKEKGKMPADAFVVKTIVTTEMVRKICDEYGVKLIDVLTGFKFIGEKIKEYEKIGKKDSFMFGFEESYGCLRGTYARDKDAVVAAMLITEMAADYKKQGKTLYDAINDLYEKYGYFKESLETKTLKGIEGTEKIKEIMAAFRNNKDEFDAIEMIDYKDGIDNLPKSDVLRFILKDGWFAVRPSGTEPKIKFYFGVNADDNNKADEKLNLLKNTVMELADKI